MSWPSPRIRSAPCSASISSTATITALAVALAWIAPTHAVAAEPAANDAPTDPFAVDGPAIQETGDTEDEVVLENGGFVRGRISEMSPGERVVVVPSAGGDSREIAWSDIAVVRRGTGTAAPAQPATQPAAQPATQPATQPEVRPATQPDPFIGTSRALVPVDIEVENGKDVTLYEVTGETVAVGLGVAASVISFRPVCESPCGKALGINPAASYFVGGPGLSDSGGFSIRDRDHVTLKVHAGSDGMRTGGWVLIIVGSLALATGIVLVSASIGEIDDEAKRNFKVGGGASLGGGLALVGGGVPMVYFGRTTVRVFSRGGPDSR